ncbi:MAG: cupin domain-containing protein [Hyphomicrobiaceae bacterium]
MTDRVISKLTAPHYAWGGDCDGWHLVRQPGLSIIHERMPTGRVEVRHHHTQARQFFFVLEGTLTLEVDGTIRDLGRGEGLEIAPLAVHQAINRSGADVEFLVISQPPAQGDRVVADREAPHVAT